MLIAFCKAYVNFVSWTVEEEKEADNFEATYVASIVFWQV